jgi:uncharacterized protein YjbI with pentapeptide repeats
MRSIDKKQIELAAALKRCSLVGAYMDRMDLRGKDLSGADLSGASLRGADLSEANFTGARLTRADLSRACLYRANFTGAIMDGCDLSMTYARSTTFKDASMALCSFRGVTYKDCYFWNTYLVGSDFRGAWLLGTLWCNANLAHARNLRYALFYWYRNRDTPGAPPVFEPREGYEKIGRSAIPGYSFQENAGRGRVNPWTKDV